MANDLNSVSIIGRLAKDSEMAMTSSGLELLKFSLAFTTTIYKDGKYVDQSNFLDSALWGKRASALLPYMKKGQQVGIQGHLEMDRWETADGRTGTKLSLKTENITLIGSRNSTEQVQPNSVKTPQTDVARPVAESHMNIDDIPF